MIFGGLVGIVSILPFLFFYGLCSIAERSAQEEAPSVHLAPFSRLRLVIFATSSSLSAAL